MVKIPTLLGSDVEADKPTFDWTDENVDLFMMACQSGDQNACDTIVKSDEALASLNRRSPKQATPLTRSRGRRGRIDDKGFDADWDEVVSTCAGRSKHVHMLFSW